MTTVHFISSIATPHVNTILASLSARPGIDLRLHYAAETQPGYPEWKNNPTHLVQQAAIYGANRPNAGFLAELLRKRREHLIVVGWSNPTTRALLLLMEATQRRFLFFTDEPQENISRGAVKSVIRAAYLQILRRRAIVLATGRNAVAYFHQNGIPAAHLVNAPIPTTIPTNVVQLRAQRSTVRARYGVPEDCVFAVTGSRFVQAKGFDVLLRAVATLESKPRQRLRVLVVGSGPEEARLRRDIAANDLNAIVTLAPWMETGDFEAVFASADLAIHPSRFDGYGATSLMAVGLGLPIVGSRAAGSAAELVEHGRNGFLYDAEDVDALAGHLKYLIERPATLVEMGRHSSELASRWSPEKVADVFVHALSLLE